MSTVTLRLILDGGAIVLADMDKAQAVELLKMWTLFNSVKALAHSEDGKMTRSYVRLVDVMAMEREVEVDDERM